MFRLRMSHIHVLRYNTGPTSCYNLHAIQNFYCTQITNANYNITSSIRYENLSPLV